MDIRHLCFDRARKLFPVSSTAVRDELGANWKYLPKAVKRDYAIKVAILGTESTGKTTLTKRLARHFNASYVLEAGREFIANSNTFDFEDLELVAREHSRRIEETIEGEHPLIIIDTDIHITLSYSEFVFNRPLPVEEAIYRTNKAHLYLYLNPDVDFIQDGSRLSEKDRNLLDASHRKVLWRHSIPYVEIAGNYEERFRMAVKSIQNILEQKGIRILNNII